MLFQSTLPAWGETNISDPNPFYMSISIHSPRMGRDGPPARRPRADGNFNPLSPHGERPTGRNPAPGALSIFQSTLPAWGETAYWLKDKDLVSISIHSPRMGRDRGIDAINANVEAFQSTLPAWGETSSRNGSMTHDQFQSTLPAWGETSSVLEGIQNRIFQSTLPAWGETDRRAAARPDRCISIHSPRMGRDAAL